MKLTRYKGRPEDTEGRLAKEVRVYDYLDGLGIEYERIDHENADSEHPEVLAAVEEALDAKICKNLFLANRQRTRFYMLMMPMDKVFRSSDVSRQAGSSRLHFAEAEYMEKYLDTTPGSASVMGLINDTEGTVNLLIDEDLLDQEYIGCHPCINTSSLRIRSSDVFGRFLDSMNRSYMTIHIDQAE